MISLAVAEPPGELMRSTTALIVSSSAALSSARRMSLLAAIEPPNSDGWLAPGTIMPST